jgi:phage baseplate assembly protein gpV
MNPSVDIGWVVATYPQSHCIDVLLPNGDRLAGIQAMVPSGSDTHGSVNLPTIGGPLDESRWNIAGPRSRFMRAVVTYVRGIAFCSGFLLPQTSQVTFDQVNRKVERHASDVYSTIDGSGNMETYHPSGTYFRVGSNPAHEDLTGKNYQENWAIEENTGSAPWVNLTVANAGAVVANIQIDPEGNVSLTNTGNLTADVSGTTTVNSGGAATLKAPSVTINSPATTITGTLLVEGAVTFESGMTGSGGSGATVTIDGSIATTGDQVAGGVSQIGHTHGGVQEGGDQTDPPTPGT